MIALVDVNSFYASCEQVFRPDLWGKPVVVLSNNDGCIIAANREAKDLGIPMWKPAFQSLPTLEAYGVEVFSSNYPLYGDMSARVMECLRSLSPGVEVYSIDEAFVQVPNSIPWREAELEAYGHELRTRVHQWTGLPVGVGLAPTKALAKVANRLAKRERKRSNHVWAIADEAKRIASLEATPLEEVWGIGRRISKRLEDRGLKHALDFSRMEDGWVQREFSVVELRLKRELEGQVQLELELEPPAKKMIGTAKSFGNNLEDKSLILEALAWYVAEVSVKLRRQHSLAGRMSIFLETNRFRAEDPQYTNQTQLRLPVPTDDSAELTRYARFGFEKIYRPGYRYKKVGVWLSDLVRPTAVQQNLFDPDPGPRRGEVMELIDSINRKYGKARLRFAAAGFRRDDWKLRQERLSPRYTTCFHEVLQVG